MATRAKAGESGRVHVVFVHGLFAKPRTWSAFETLLAHDEDLSGKVVTHCFAYNSPVFRLRPDRQIAELDDVADQLATELGVLLDEDDIAVLVSHSQGGLIVQRFLARTLADGRGPSLAPVKSIVMFACPNNGSSFFLVLRQLMVFWRHNQERQLRLSPRAVVETQRTILRAVVNADSRTASTWPIPVYAYGGSTDNVVRPNNARGNFPAGGVVDGNHSSLVRPTGTRHASYQVVKSEIVKAIRLMESPPAPAARSGSARPETNNTAPPSGTPHPLSPHSVDPRHGLRRGRLYGRTRNNIITRIMTAGPDTPVHVLTGLGGVGFDAYGAARVQPAVMRFGVGVSDHRDKGIVADSYWPAVDRANADWKRLGLPRDPFHACREALGERSGRRAWRSVAGAGGRWPRGWPASPTMDSRCISTTRCGSSAEICWMTRSSRSSRSTCISASRNPAGRPWCGGGAGPRPTRSSGSRIHTVSPNPLSRARNHSN